MNRSYVKSSTGTAKSRREVDSAEGWWRWPLVPLAAIAASFAAMMAISFCGWYAMKMIGGFYEDGWIYRYILPVVGSGWAGFAWCYSSAYVAPRQSNYLRRNGNRCQLNRPVSRWGCFRVPAGIFSSPCRNGFKCCCNHRGRGDRNRRCRATRTGGSQVAMNDFSPPSRYGPASNRVSGMSHCR